MHSDSIRRFQQQDTIDLSGDAPVVVEGALGSGGNRSQVADALSLWIEDDIDLGKLILSPGVPMKKLKVTGLTSQVMTQTQKLMVLLVRLTKLFLV
jgi:outer membrane receptor for Fe3+-dicitrate